MAQKDQAASGGKKFYIRENRSDPIGDMLARIRNGLHRNMSSVVCAKSNKKVNVLKVLQDEGYIRGFEDAQDDRGHPVLRIDLKYHEGEPVIRELQRVSKPGRRAYFGAEDLPQVRNGLGVAIVTTNQGVMSDAEARERNVGGEVICTVF
ncbi:MAG: 30S ribosomal protein S8 [Neomegalonema sp.]|nr:30S ribosomal protein S8 [Neomegalonema sp.]